MVSPWRRLWLEEDGQRRTPSDSPDYSRNIHPRRTAPRADRHHASRHATPPQLPEKEHQTHNVQHLLLFWIKLFGSERRNVRPAHLIRKQNEFQTRRAALPEEAMSPSPGALSRLRHQ